jgi:hypothetical protein
MNDSVTITNTADLASSFARRARVDGGPSAAGNRGRTLAQKHRRANEDGVRGNGGQPVLICGRNRLIAR